MKILIYAAGPLGSLFTARLHEAGHEVSLLARGQRLACTGLAFPMADRWSAHRHSDHCRAYFVVSQISDGERRGINAAIGKRR